MTGPVPDAFRSMPLIAILRGLDPDQAGPAARALSDGGIRLVEVPLNGPRPLQAIGGLARTPELVTGAGTVLSAEDVRHALDAGARFIVAPNFDPEVVGAAIDAGVPAIPGVATPTEAFAALAAGAWALKLFPAEIIGPAGLKALKAVLPAPTRLIPVGGVGTETVALWRQAGAAGAGLGSALFKPGIAAGALKARAEAAVAAWSGRCGKEEEQE